MKLLSDVPLEDQKFAATGLWRMQNEEGSEYSFRAPKGNDWYETVAIPASAMFGFLASSDPDSLRGVMPAEDLQFLAAFQ
mgnify:CR=1 FL=1